MAVPGLDPGIDPAIHAEAPQRLVPHWRGPQQEPANAKVFGLWQRTCRRSTRRTAWVAGSSPAMTLNPSGTSLMLPNLSSPTANAISAKATALIALAVGLSDRALIGFEEGLAEAFSAH
jgi:hypothetical protein